MFPQVWHAILQIRTDSPESDVQRLPVMLAGVVGWMKKVFVIGCSAYCVPSDVVPCMRPLSGGHRRQGRLPISASATFQVPSCSLRVSPSPGRSGTIM